MEEEAEFLAELVQVNSVTGKESELAKRLLFAFEALGAEAYIDKTGNLHAAIGEGSHTIVFNAHLDTVDPAEKEDWTHPPLSGFFDGEWVWGRGAVDMKGGIAAIYFAFKRLLAENVSLQNLRVVFAGVLQEEPAEGAAFEAFLKNNDIQPELVVICEPSNLQLIDAQRGRIEYNVVVRGISAHAAFPEDGLNAVYMAAKLVESIEGYASQLKKRQEGHRGTVCVTNIESKAVSKNGVPYECTFTIDRRLDIYETENMATSELNNIIREAGFQNSVSMEITNFSLTTYTGERLQGKNYFPPWQEENQALKGVIARAYKNVFKRNADWQKWQFGTDGSLSKGVLNIPTIGFGPGDPELAHQVNEKIRVQDVKLAADFYCELIREYSKNYEEV